MFNFDFIWFTFFSWSCSYGFCDQVKTPVSDARKTPVTQTQTTCSSQFIPIHHPGAFPPLPSRPGTDTHLTAFSLLLVYWNIPARDRSFSHSSLHQVSPRRRTSSHPQWRSPWTLVSPSQQACPSPPPTCSPPLTPSRPIRCRPESPLTFPTASRGRPAPGASHKDHPRPSPKHSPSNLRRPIRSHPKRLWNQVCSFRYSSSRLSPPPNSALSWAWAHLTTPASSR